MSEESTTVLIGNKILQNLKEGYAKFAYKDLKLLKFNDELVQLEADDVENCNSTEQAEDKDEEGYSVEEEAEEEEEEEDERDLTNLTWLTELRNQTMGLVNMALDEEPKKDIELSAAVVEPISVQLCHDVTETENSSKIKANILGQTNQRINNILQIPQQKSDEPRATKIFNQPKRPTPGERYEIFLNKIKRDLEIYEESAINYQSDVIEKPPFNYSHIIGMAMLENGRRVTLQQICTWIERKFAFFRVRKKWNNSIRHNLSLHPCFRKIGRNKEDKGKGGYWELGVDPKKCDRKRIRNRKSTAQPNKTQKKHLQAHFIKTSKRRQQNFSNMKKSYLRNCNDNLRNLTTEQNYEELLLDEMDVQQNVDVVSSTNNQNTNVQPPDSCYKHNESHAHAALQHIHEAIEHHTNEQQQDRKHRQLEEVVFKNYIDNDNEHMHLQENDDFKEFNKRCSLTGDGEGEGACHPNEQFSGQTCQPQQYKVGTIIISSTNMDADMPNVENSNQRTLTSFLANNTKKLLFTEERSYTNNISYSDFENVPQNDNVIISSYIPNLNLTDEFSASANESKSYQRHSLSESSSTSSITLDFSAFPAQSMQYKPNVIVEQLIQEPSSSYTAIKSSSPLSSSSAAQATTVGALHGDFANGFVNDHFRPYIDGIDEAFQYLRSIDSTRNEDILDNLLDISVSDY